MVVAAAAIALGAVLGSGALSMEAPAQVSAKTILRRTAAAVFPKPGQVIERRYSIVLRCPRRVLCPPAVITTWSANFDGTYVVDARVRLLPVDSRHGTLLVHSGTIIFNHMHDSIGYGSPVSNGKLSRIERIYRWRGPARPRQYQQILSEISNFDSPKNIALLIAPGCAWKRVIEHGHVTWQCPATFLGVDRRPNPIFGFGHIPPKVSFDGVPAYALRLRGNAPWGNAIVEAIIVTSGATRTRLERTDSYRAPGYTAYVNAQSYAIRGLTGSVCILIPRAVRVGGIYYPSHCLKHSRLSVPSCRRHGRSASVVCRRGYFAATFRVDMPCTGWRRPTTPKSSMPAAENDI